MDDDIHFRNEERKKTGLGGGGGGEGWEKKAAAAVKRKGEEKCFAWLQSKRGGGRRVFSLTPGSSSDRRLCVSLRARVLTCMRARITAGLIRQRFPGTREDVGEGPGGS